MQNINAEQQFVEHIDALKVPIFTATRGGEREFARPLGWQKLDAADNCDRIDQFRPGDAIAAVMGGPIACVDVDTRNGGDIKAVRHLLATLEVTVFAEIVTPSGGVHFYIAGHRDLPTVHSGSGDKPKLRGFPGVDIQSHGSNMFLPGTLRPKYDGRGYTIVFDNLEALNDGGDPDGAEALAGWVAANREHTAEQFDPAPPWNGTPPDARQAGYLAAVLRSQAVEISAMGPDSGRNQAVYEAGLKCGNFVAGAGMDEQLVRHTLEKAADACGLTADDGRGSVLATIQSGLTNGKRRPRAVPAPPDTPRNASSSREDHAPAAVVATAGESEVITYDGRYFDRAGLRARTLLRDCELLGPLASGIDGKVWAYVDGVWVHGDRVLRSRVVDLLGERFRRAHADTIESMVQAREPFINDTPVTDYLNVENGLLEWRTGRLLPHTDKVASTTRIPVRWNPDAVCPNIDEFLQSVVDAECVPVLEEVAGYALYPDQPLHKAVMLDGTGRNGKGVYLRIMSALIGPANIAAAPPQRLDTDKWAVAQLYGKLANLVGDVDPRTFRETATFKQATGQDVLQGEHKYGAPFTFTSRALIVAAFNSLPRSADTTEGFFSRWLVVPFPNRFVDPDEDGNVPDGCRAKDPELAAKVTSTAELEGFLVRAVAGLQRVMELGRFSRADAVTRAESEFRRHADPVRGFLAEGVVADRDGWVSRADLHAAFKAWATDAGLGVFSAKRFAEKVREVHVEMFGYVCTERTRAGSRGWAGIRFRTFADEQGEPDTTGTDQVQKVHLEHVSLPSPPYAREKVREGAPSAPSAPSAPTTPEAFTPGGTAQPCFCEVCGTPLEAPESIARGLCRECALIEAA